MIRMRKILLSLVVLGAAGAAVGFATYGQFGSTTSNSGNEFQAGTVVISDNDLGNALITLPATSRPGATDSGCVTVSYDGTLTSTVRLYANVTSAGSSLAPYLSMTVTKGAGGTPSDCTGFGDDGSDYGYGANGIVFQGKLSDFPTSYAASAATSTTWTNGEDHVYRFDVTLDDNASAQGLNATAEFFWEAQNQ